MNEWNVKKVFEEPKRELINDIKSNVDAFANLIKVINKESKADETLMYSIKNFTNFETVMQNTEEKLNRLNSSFRTLHAQADEINAIVNRLNESVTQIKPTNLP